MLRYTAEPQYILFVLQSCSGLHSKCLIASSLVTERKGRNFPPLSQREKAETCVPRALTTQCWLCLASLASCSSATLGSPGRRYAQKTVIMLALATPVAQRTGRFTRGPPSSPAMWLCCRKENFPAESLFRGKSHF